MLVTGMSSASSANPRQGALDAEWFRFIMPGRLEYRDAAKAFLGHVCDRLVRKKAIPEEVAHRVISAFVEAFNNAVVHGYKGRPVAGAVEVELDVTRERLRLTVIDQGVSFKPESVPDPDLDSLPEGGMGLFIMRSFMDSVDYARDGDRNVLTMEKALKAPVGPDA
jgi:serine/threonine-protein kinase RsbW